MFITLFLNVFSVFLMMLPGFLIIRKNIISEKALKDFSHVIVKVFYPCLVFSSITNNFTLKSVIASWQLPVSIFLFSVLCYVVGLAYVGFFKPGSPDRRKALLFQFTINNYSFLPLAIIANLFDESHMAALIFSTLGAEIAVWTVGMFILNTQNGGLRRSDLKNLLAPPLIGIYLSLLILFLMDQLGLTIQSLGQKSQAISYLLKTIQQLGQATIPLALIMVGGRMGRIKPSDLKSKDIWGATFFRLILLPLMGVLLLQTFFPEHLYLNVMLIVVVMPNSVVSLVFGELYGADQKLMSGTVLVSHLLALITIPIWLQILL